jgi:hypothetical protein
MTWLKRLAKWLWNPTPKAASVAVDPAATYLRGTEQAAWQNLPAHARERIVMGLRENLVQEGLLGMGGFMDPDAQLTAAQGGSAYYRRLTQSPRDLHPILQMRMIEIAAWLYDTNPLAKRVLELTRDFVLGDGLHVAAQDRGGDADVGPMQEVLDAFWSDPFNRLDLRLHDHVLELGLFGEWIPTVGRNPADGSLRLGHIDPALVKEVVFARDNVLQPVAVVLADPVAADQQRYKVVQVVEDPNSALYGRMAGAETDETGRVIERWQDYNLQGEVTLSGTYAGSCFLFQINKISNSQRGRSDLLCLADWVDAYDQVLFNTIDRGLLMKSFVWDVTLEGMNETEIDAYARKQAAPKPGSVRYHNERVAWAAVQPDLKAIDDQIGADLLQSYVSTGAGMAKTWLNGTMDVNRATAEGLSEPAIARMAARQRYVKYIVGAIATAVLDAAEVAGRLPRRPERPGSTLPTPWPIAVEAPELRANDQLKQGQTLAAVASALATARADDAIDVQVEQQALAMVLTSLGVEVDLDAMRTRIADEVKQREQQRQEQAALMLQRAELSARAGQPTPTPNGAPTNGKTPANA